MDAYGTEGYWFESSRVYSGKEAPGSALERTTPLVSRGSVPSTPEHSTPSSRKIAHADAPKSTQNTPQNTPQPSTVVGGRTETDPDLAAVIDAWDRLPEAVRAGIVAIVQAAVK
jgi:hypothetical protein